MSSSSRFPSLTLISYLHASSLLYLYLLASRPSAFRGMPLYYSQGHSYHSYTFFKSAFQYAMRTCWSFFAHIWLLPFYSLVHEVAFTTERRSPLSCFCGSYQRVLGMLWSNPFPKCQYCYWLHVEFVLFALSFLLLFIVLSFCCTPLACLRCHPSMAFPPEPCHILPRSPLLSLSVFSWSLWGLRGAPRRGATQQQQY